MCACTEQHRNELAVRERFWASQTTLVCIALSGQLPGCSGTGLQTAARRTIRAVVAPSSASSQPSASIASELIVLSSHSGAAYAIKDPTADIPRLIAAAEACACSEMLRSTARSVARRSGSPLASSLSCGSSSKSSCICRSDSGSRCRVPRPTGTSFCCRCLRALRSRRVLSGCRDCVSVLFSWGIPRHYSLLLAIPTAPNPAPRSNFCFSAQSNAVQRSPKQKGGRKGSKKAP
jgi:hypothetical protein